MGDRRRDPSRQLRLLLVVDSLHIGGAQRHTIDLALGLAGRGHSVTVAASCAGLLGEHLEGSRVELVSLFDAQIAHRVSRRYADGLRRLLLDGRFDLVHSHMFASSAAVALANLETSVPHVVSEHSEGRWQQSAEREISRGYVSRAGRVIAVSANIRDRLVRDLGVSRDAITIIPNGVAPLTEVDMRPVPEIEGLARPLVGVVGRLSPEKGQDVLLEAVALLPDDCGEGMFAIVGDGDFRPSLEAQTRRLGVDSQVRFLGAIPNARSFVRRVDVLAVPSRVEGTPLVTLDAMAAGVPVVATGVGGIPTQIRHGYSGLLVPPEDPDALARALLELIRGANVARSLGAAAREAAKRHSFDAMLDATEDVYGEAMATGPTAAYSGSATRSIPAS